MGIQAAVVYPSVSSFDSASQLNIGPYLVPDVKTLIRVESRGRVNFQGVSSVWNTVLANTLLWAVQWVPHGDTPNDVVTTADGLPWLIRQQLGTADSRVFWTPDSSSGTIISSDSLEADWAGQLPVNESIDLYLSARTPTGGSSGNLNVYGSLRFWWN